jgi:CHAT domain-containing protein
VAPHVGAILAPPDPWAGASFDRPLVLGAPRDPDRPPLPAAREEALAVGGLLGATPILDEAATLSRVAAAAADADLIYAASHGVASSSAPLDDSYIALADGDRWTARAIKGQALHARLAVLSACSTGEGMAVDGGVIGLARAFQIAGVPRVVMSLWPVDDRATAALMVAFVRHLAEAPPAEALRRAMLDRRAVDPAPRTWAAFTLFGSAG